MSGVVDDKVILRSVKQWFEQVVVGLNLCPFARKPWLEDRIRFSVCDADNDQELLQDVLNACSWLESRPEIETLVLIVSHHLAEFEHYNQFLSLAEELLRREDLSGTFQIASFHPDYRFADTQSNDRGNWTNRSPYPLLHLLRESSISEAVASYPDVAEIPRRNIELFENLTDETLSRLFPRRYIPR